jgi:UV excision repair protein RAD23
MGPELEQAIANIMELGFPRDQVERAMRASFNHPDRAVEYLMSGQIPEQQETPQQSTQPETTNHLEFLRNNPYFQQLRQAVQQDPSLLEPLLLQLAQSNPRLMESIEEHQDEFMELMLGEHHPTSSQEDPQQPNIHYINITPEEKEAIDRLVAMGFDQADAIQAYLACDKNEELAANFLFDQLNEQD